MVVILLIFLNIKRFSVYVSVETSILIIFQ